LRDGALLLEGQELPPGAVSTYLPRLLQDLSVYLPAEPSRAEAEAGLRIAQEAQRTAISRNPQVRVQALEQVGEVPDVAYQAAVRQVVVSHDQPEGARLVSTPAGGLVLVIGGDDTQLDQTESDARLGLRAPGGRQRGEGRANRPRGSRGSRA
jgi:hypothetical protein